MGICGASAQTGTARANIIISIALYGGLLLLATNLFTIPARQKGKWSTAWLAHSSGTSTQSIYDTDIKDYYDYKFILYGSLKKKCRVGASMLFCCIEL